MKTSPFNPLIVAALCGLVAGASASPVPAAEAPGDVKQRADQSFDRLSQQPETGSASKSHPVLPAGTDEGTGRYAPDKFWIGQGLGDLTKGKIVCQRVSELGARTDLAKQIRVMVKEHMVDRVRDRTGREPEQDIELTREELVQEYLQDVRIVDHRIDEEGKTCHATAVMPKAPLQQKPLLDSDRLPPSK